MTLSEAKSIQDGTTMEQVEQMAKSTGKVTHDFNMHGDHIVAKEYPMEDDKVLITYANGRVISTSVRVP